MSEFELDVQRERAAQSQSMFREVNERIALLAPPTDAVDFVCECLRAECDQPISLTAEVYERIRSDPNRFFVLAGHEDPKVEVVVEASDGYYLVSKVGAGAAVAKDLDPRQRANKRH